MQSVDIAIVGDFDRSKHSHWATEAALFHAAAKLRITVLPRWVSTPEVEADAEAALRRADGIWGAPGSPFESAKGMLQAITYARCHNKPYLGTCAGFQYALIELTRSLLDMPDADSAENHPSSGQVVITPVQCEAPRRAVPRLLGRSRVSIEPGSLLAALCRAGQLDAEFFCSYEVNAAFEARWQDAGVRFCARGDGGEPRALELPTHRFFLATLFQPQLSTSLQEPHPIVTGFLQAAHRAG